MHLGKWVNDTAVNPFESKFDKGETSRIGVTFNSILCPLLIANFLSSCLSNNLLIGCFSIICHSLFVSERQWLACLVHLCPPPPNDQSSACRLVRKSILLRMPIFIMQLNQRNIKQSQYSKMMLSKFKAKDLI